jgi:ribonucleoside-diphosphate reductase alpha chain
MSIKALAEYTRISKYSKYLPEKKRRETWEEQINRVFDMHEKHLGDKLDSIKEDFYFAKDMMLKKRILGSQRALQFGGDPILKKHERIFNCCASYCDRPRFFQELLFLLLAGCGAGTSFQKKDVDKLPPISKREEEKAVFVVEDSIEGWADSLGALVSSYFTKDQPFPEYFGKTISFDFSKIRPAGSAVSWGGKAPGPDALRKSLQLIEGIFENILKENRNKLKPIEAYDIIMHASDGVISGGVRRCLPSFYSIKMSDGSYKNITQVKKGDSIQYMGRSYTVNNTYVNGVQRLLKIDTEDGFHVSTPNHKWLAFNHIKETEEWVMAKDLNQNYSLMSEA